MASISFFGSAISFTRTARRPIIYASLLVAAAACGSNEADPSSPDSTIATPMEGLSKYGVSYDPNIMVPAGSEMFDGIDVLEGSQLVGTTVTIRSISADNGSALDTAILVLDGEPVDVWNRYVEAFGISDIMSAKQACVVRAVTDPESDENTPERFLTDEPIAGENSITCSARFDRGSLFLSAGIAERTGLPVGHIVMQRNRIATPTVEGIPSVRLETDTLRYQRGRDEDPVPSESSPPYVIPDGPLFPPTLPTDSTAQPLPEPQDRLDNGIDYYLDNADIATLPDGFTSLVSPVLVGNCNSGLVALLSYDGTAEDAISHIRFDDDKQPTIRRYTDAVERDVFAANASEPGGYSIDFYATQASADTSTVAVFGCGD